MLYTPTAARSTTATRSFTSTSNAITHCVKPVLPSIAGLGCILFSWGCSNNSRRHSLAPCAVVTTQSGMSPSEITILIKECHDYGSLRAVLQDQGPFFNFIHAAAAFTHAAQIAQQLLLNDRPAAIKQPQQHQGDSDELVVAQQQQQLHWQELSDTLPLLLLAVQQQCSSFQGRQVANCLWAANKLLHALVQQQQHSQQVDQQAAQPSQQQLLQLTQQLIEQTQYCWHLFTGQELALLLYAVTNMPIVAAAAVAAGTTCAGSSSSSSSLGAQPQAANVTGGSEGLSEPAAATDTASVSFIWADKALQQLQRLHRSSKLRLKPQEFEMLLISIRKLQHQQQEQQQQQQHLQLPYTLLQQLLAAVAERSHRCSSRDIAGILYSIAALEIRPSSSVIAKVLAPLSPGSRTLRSCNPADVTNILYALAALGYRPWQQQQQQGSEATAIKGLILQLWQQRQQYPPAELAVCLYSLGRLQVHLPAAASEALAVAAVTRLQPQQQQEVVLLCWNLAASGVKPDPVLLQAIHVKFLRGMAAAVEASTAAAGTTDNQQQQQHQWDYAAQHVAMLLWSLGRFCYCPPRLLLLPLLQLSQLLLQHAAPEHLACMCWGLAQIGVRPSMVWLSGFYNQLVWFAEQQNPVPSPVPAGSRAARVEGSGAVDVGFSGRQVQVGFLGLSGQNLAMIVWGLVRMQVGQQEQASTTTAAAAGVEQTTTGPTVAVLDLLRIVLQASETTLQRSPLSVGVILWGCVKLGSTPEPATLQAVLQAFLGGQQPQQRGAQRQRQQQQQQLSAQQQQLYAQSLALTVWALAKLGATDDQKQQLVQVLWANVQQVKHMSPIDLTTITWGLNKLQLRPPTPWLLSFYISSQSQFDRFTDVRLSSLVVPLYALLQQQQQPGGQQAQEEPQQLGQVPPAVWQLQLELQMQSRWKRRRRRKLKQRGGEPATTADEGSVQPDGRQQQHQQLPALGAQGDQEHRRRQVHDPLRIVEDILRRWRAVSVGSSTAAAAQQLPVDQSAVV